MTRTHIALLMGLGVAIWVTFDEHQRRVTAEAKVEAANEKLHEAADLLFRGRDLLVECSRRIPHEGKI